MAVERTLPVWYRGPKDAAWARVVVCEELRWMRRKARLTQAQMAQNLGRELVRRIPESSVARWESGAKLAGADVYRAYIVISGAGLPTDLDGIDQRAAPSRRLQGIEQRMALLERQVGLAPPGEDPPLDDLISTDEAALRVHRSRQTIHNWVKAEAVRHQRQGRKLWVSLADVLAEAARQDRGKKT